MPKDLKLFRSDGLTTMDMARVRYVLDALFIHRPKTFWGAVEPHTRTVIDFPVSILLPSNAEPDHIRGMELQDARAQSRFYFSSSKFQTLLEVETVTGWDDYLPDFLRRVPEVVNAWLEADYDASTVK
jgi:hypothetical protein